MRELARIPGQTKRGRFGAEKVDGRLQKGRERNTAVGVSLQFMLSCVRCVEFGCFFFCSALYLCLYLCLCASCVRSFHFCTLLYFVVLLLYYCWAVCRSQAELKAGISGLEAREAEEAFFRQHSHFKGCDPKLFGITNLTNR